MRRKVARQKPDYHWQGDKAGRPDIWPTTKLTTPYKRTEAEKSIFPYIVLHSMEARPAHQVNNNSGHGI